MVTSSEPNRIETMRAEVVAVGTELLLGQIVDTNSAFIGERLALAGIDCNFATKVGDNIERIASVLRRGPRAKRRRHRLWRARADPG